MCDAAVEKDPWLVKYVPDWFITKESHRVRHGRREREERRTFAYCFASIKMVGLVYDRR